MHRYPDHLFIAIHAPKIGARGHVHYLELDQFIGEHFLVTVHGPLNPVVPLEDALRETREVVERMERGRLRPASPFALTYAIVSTVVRHETDMVNELAREVGLLEQAVISAVDEEPQEFLGKLFMVRHELLTIKTMASQASEIYRRAVTIVDFAPADGLAKMRDVLDQYERVASIAQSQLEFLQGVTEFYRARTDTKMTIAGEKLAVIAALTLPITAISSVMGMNVIVNGSTHWAAADHPAGPDGRAGAAAAALGQAAGLVVSRRTDRVPVRAAGSRTRRAASRCTTGGRPRRRRSS